MRMIAGVDLDGESCGFDGGLCRSKANGMVLFADVERHRDCILIIDGLKANCGALRSNDSISNDDGLSCRTLLSTALVSFGVMSAEIDGGFTRYFTKPPFRASAAK